MTYNVFGGTLTKPYSINQSIFTPQPQGVIALWLVLIAPTHKGMARLS